MSMQLPDSPEALAEFLGDDDRAKEAFATEENRKEFLAAYNSLMNKSGKLSEELSADVSATMVEILKEWGVDDRPDMSEMAAKVASSIHTAGLADQPVSVYNPKAAGSAVDDIVATTGDFFKAIWHNSRDPESQRIRNALSEKVPSEGGFLVPERLRSQLLQTALESSIVRSRARVIPMDSLRVPFPAIDETSHASSVFGGIIGYWTEEAGTITQSDPSFRQVVLDAKKLTAYTQAPNELLSDSVISFQSFIDTVFPQALAWWEDVGFVEGSGAGEPQGFLNASAAISVAKETGQAADTIVWENLVKMYSRMLPGSLSSAVWVASIDTFPQLATMALSVGTGGSAIWLTAGSEGPPMTILGRPVLFTEKVPVVGDLGDINFVDFSMYLIGDRQQMTATSSEHFKFQTDQTAFRIIERVDGRPWVNSALTPKNSGATLSPFVKLAARA